MKDFTVTTEPCINNQVAEFEFHVTLEKKIGAHERFYLHLFSGFIRDEELT